MIKLGHIEFYPDENGYQGAANCVASYILSESNFSNYREYKPCATDDYTGCIVHEVKGEESFSYRCPDYKDASRLLMTADKISMLVRSLAVSGAEEYITKMIEFDALILNTGRSYDSIKVVENRMAPLDNFGSAFLSESPITCNIKSAIQKLKSQPFANTFYKQVSAVRSLYGSHLQIRKGIDLTPLLKDLAKIYDKQVIDRIQSIWEIQKATYSDLFV